MEDNRKPIDRTTDFECEIDKFEKNLGFINIHLKIAFYFVVFSEFGSKSSLREAFFNFSECGFKDSLIETISAYSGNSRTFTQVYALRSRNVEGSAVNNLLEIKRILLDQNERNRYIEDEGFRLATFSLSPNDYDRGEILRLAAEGFYYDVDSQVKCAFCGKTKSQRVVHERGSHDNNCIILYPNLPGRTIAEHLGASSPQWLVPSTPNLLVNNRIGTYPDSVFFSPFHFGNTEQVTEEQGEEDCHSVSRRRGCLPTVHNSDIQHNVSVLQDSHINQHQEQENKVRNEVASVRSAKQADMSQNASAAQDSCTNQDHEQGSAVGDEALVLTGTQGDIGATSTSVTENERWRSRALCRVCRKRRRNIVFRPCGHLVVCGSCIRNVTICPSCKTQVETAITINKPQ